MLVGDYGQGALQGKEVENYHSEYITILGGRGKINVLILRTDYPK